MKRILLMVSLCLGWANAQQAVTLPPRRVAFDAKAPTSILLGKLWWDIGLFHPFTGEVSRDQWEKGFFALMNKSTEPGADANVLAAEALALLKDPASLLLEKGEGRGKWALPIIWEVKDGKAWIIGGDKDQITEPFGPVETIDGKPIQEFLVRRLGSFRSDDRVYAALSLAGRRSSPFVSKFGSGANTCSIASVGDISWRNNAWIKGDWKVVPFFALAGGKVKAIDHLKRLPAMDFRASNCIRVEDAHNVENLMIFMGAQSAPQPMVRLVREHRGQYDEDWDRFALDSGSYNRIAAHPAPNHISFVKQGTPAEVTLPQVILDPHAAEILAGWGFPASLNVSARDTQYAFGPGMEVRLRLDSWSSSLADAKHEATYQNGGLLSKEAAKALAAASIIQFDHLFGFTPEGMQAGVFKAAIETAALANGAYDLVQRAGGITKDAHVSNAPHAPLNSPLDGILEKLTLDGLTTMQPFPLIPAYLTDKGEVRLLRSLTGIAKAGAIIDSIKGVPVTDLARKVLPFTWSRPEHRDSALEFGHLAIGGAFGQPVLAPGDSNGPAIAMEVRDPATNQKSTTSLPGWFVSENMCEPFQPPAGWEIAKRGADAPTVTDIAKMLEAGKKVIIDTRGEKPLNVEKGWQLPEGYSTPSQSSFRRTPYAPFAWGTDPYEDRIWQTQVDATFAVRGYTQPVAPSKKVLPGQLVVVVSGATLSILEFSATWLRAAFPNNIKVVGLPTAGSMGVRSWINLPIGGGDNALAIYTPTVSWATVNGKNHSYTGVPLDRQVTEAELLKEMAAGSPDPVMTAGLKALGIR